MTVEAADGGFTVEDDQLMRTALEGGASLAGLAAGAVRIRSASGILPALSNARFSLLTLGLFAGEVLETVHRRPANRPLEVTVVSAEYFAPCRHRNGTGAEELDLNDPARLLIPFEVSEPPGVVLNAGGSGSVNASSWHGDPTQRARERLPCANNGST